MTNPIPRDPLANATLLVPEGERVVSNVPEAYRLTREQGWVGNYPMPTYTLQGCFKTYNAQGMVEYEWRDIPTVELN